MERKMEFTEIDDDNSVFPGEYIYHEPSSAIVLAGAFNRKEDYIRGLKQGKYSLETYVEYEEKIKFAIKEGKDEEYIANLQKESRYFSGLLDLALSVGSDSGNEEIQ